MAWPNVYGLDVHRFDEQRTQQRQPTFLLLHDAFHAPSHFDELAHAFGAAGRRVLIPQLPSASPNFHSNALDADIRTIINYGKPEIDNTRNVVMVAHGYGAIPSAMAAERLNRYSLDRPRAGRVVKLVFIAGVVLQQNESYLDVVDSHWISRRQGMARVQSPGDLFFQDCSPETRAAAMSLVSSQNESSLQARVINPGWSRIPTLYLICEQDRAISSQIQYGFVRTLQASNRQATVVAVQTGHCPFLTLPTETAELIMGSC